MSQHVKNTFAMIATAAIRWVAARDSFRRKNSNQNQLT